MTRNDEIKVLEKKITNIETTQNALNNLGQLK